MTLLQPSWYVVQTHPHAENKAAAHLQRQGFATYLPRYLKRRRRPARRTESIAAPLFPRYLFVALDLKAQQWRCVQYTLGVARLVGSSDEPTPVSDAIVRGIQLREDSSGLVSLQQGPRFALGEKIRVRDGAFCDQLGLFEGVTDATRVAILIDLLGRKVKVVLDAECVQAA